GELLAFKLGAGNAVRNSAPTQSARAPQAAAAGAPPYTAAQAARGRTLYGQQCAACHGLNLEGIEMSPSLAGGDFMDRWKGQTMGDLSERVQTTMPKTKPGTLSGQDNAAIVAY